MSRVGLSLFPPGSWGKCLQGKAGYCKLSDILDILKGIINSFNHSCSSIVVETEASLNN